MAKLAKMTEQKCVYKPPNSKFIKSCGYHEILTLQLFMSIPSFEYSDLLTA